MSKLLQITVADKVYKEIEELRSSNRSEFVEELIREGIRLYKMNLEKG